MQCLADHIFNPIFCTVFPDIKVGLLFTFQHINTAFKLNKYSLYMRSGV